MNHFRAFRIWVAQNSAMRVSSTIWWFLPSFVIDNSLLSVPTDEISYPPTRTRPNPQADGTDLLGRHFFEPDLGVCCVTRLGPVTNKQMPSRAQRNVTTTDKPISYGPHFTLYYTCLATKEEHYSSVDEVVQWIRDGPILIAPPQATPSSPNLTAPPYARPEPYDTTISVPAEDAAGPTHDVPSENQCTPPEATPRNCDDDTPPRIIPVPLVTPSGVPPQRKSSRVPVPRDLLKPTHKGKVYSSLDQRIYPRKQRVPVTLEYPGKQRVTKPERKSARVRFSLDENWPFCTTAPAVTTRQTEHSRGLVRHLCWAHPRGHSGNVR